MEVVGIIYLKTNLISYSLCELFQPIAWWVMKNVISEVFFKSYQINSLIVLLVVVRKILICFFIIIYTVIYPSYELSCRIRSCRMMEL